jgi:phosphate transport system substrate-binding protein
VIHIPTVIGAVVLTYNLPGVGAASSGSTPPRWRDLPGPAHQVERPPHRGAQPGVPLPNQDIIVVHRSDGSGTTYVFVDYLSKVSPEWKEKVGRATSVNWPVGLGGKGNEGVTQQVRQTEGAIGYVELIYAISNSLPYAILKNAAGNYVEPTLETATAAAAGIDLPADTDFRVSITNAEGPNAYPITSFTWLLLRKESQDTAKSKAIWDFVRWMSGAEGAAAGRRPALPRCRCRSSSWCGGGFRPRAGGSARSSSM